MLYSKVIIFNVELNMRLEQSSKWCTLGKHFCREKSILNLLFYQLTGRHPLKLRLAHYGSLVVIMVKCNGLDHNGHYGVCYHYIEDSPGYLRAMFLEEFRISK